MFQIGDKIKKQVYDCTEMKKLSVKIQIWHISRSNMYQTMIRLNLCEFFCIEMSSNVKATRIVWGNDLQEESRNMNLPEH